MNKRGAYFFVIDAMIAASIIFVSLMIIFASYSLQPESNPTLRMAEDYATFLMNTSIRQFQGDYVQLLINNNNITDQDNTLLEQLTEFYYLNSNGIDKSQIMANFTQEISQGIIPDQRSFAVYLNNTLIYNRTSNANINTTKLLLSTKKISFKRINETVIYGPIILDIRIWV